MAAQDQLDIQIAQCFDLGLQFVGRGKIADHHACAGPDKEAGQGRTLARQAEDDHFVAGEGLLTLTCVQKL